MTGTSKVIAMFPEVEKLKEHRKYSEENVKSILYSFGRDLEKHRGLKPWRADRLRKFINSAFNFDE